MCVCVFVSAEYSEEVVFRVAWSSDPASCEILKSTSPLGYVK